MRLLLFNLVTDVDDPVLGFTTRWIRALAQRVEFIHVITMRAGRVEVPNNVRIHSLGKEKGESKPRRAVKFYRLLFHILGKEHIDVCFSHMTPLFTVLAASVLKAKAIPIVTWYAHPTLTWTLRLAHHLSDRMVTSIATSYPYKQDKLSIVGHGIDTDTFSPNGAGAPDHSAIILCAGRLSIVKDHPTLVKAAWLLRQRWPEPFRVVIIGGPAIGRDESYAQSLYDNVRELGLEDTVFFEAPVPGEQLPFWYRRCTVHVNLTPQGFVDKVALEAMSCAKPCLVANEGFKETLGKFADDLLFRHGDAEHLAEKLLMLLQRCERDRDEIGQYLHQQVVQLHSLNNLSQSLIEVAHDLRQHQAHGA